MGRKFSKRGTKGVTAKTTKRTVFAVAERVETGVNGAAQKRALLQKDEVLRAPVTTEAGRVPDTKSSSHVTTHAGQRSRAGTKA